MTAISITIIAASYGNDSVLVVLNSEARNTTKKNADLRLSFAWIKKQEGTVQALQVVLRKTEFIATPFYQSIRFLD